MPDPSSGGFAGDIGSIIDLIRGAQGRYTNQGNTAAALADPFASQRPQYQKQLQDLIMNPGSFQMSPGEIFARDQGLQADARQGNAMFGTTRSGNTADALNRDAVGYAQQDYNTRIQQLMSMSGVNTGSPAAAADAYLRGNATNDKAISNGYQGINDILGMLASSGLPQSAISAIMKMLGGPTQGSLGITNNPGGALGNDNIDAGGGMNPGDPLYPTQGSLGIGSSGGGVDSGGMDLGSLSGDLPITDFPLPDFESGIGNIFTGLPF